MDVGRTWLQPPAPTLSPAPLCTIPWGPKGLLKVPGSSWVVPMAAAAGAGEGGGRKR